MELAEDPRWVAGTPGVTLQPGKSNFLEQDLGLFPL